MPRNASSFHRFVQTALPIPTGSGIVSANRLHRQVVSCLPEVVPVHGQDRVAHPESPALVGGEAREDLGDEDGHPPARLLFDNSDFPHGFRGTVQTNGKSPCLDPKLDPGLPAVDTIVAVVLTPVDNSAPRAGTTPPTPVVLALELVLTGGRTAARVPWTRSRVVSVRHAISQARRRVVVVPVIAPLPGYLRLGQCAQAATRLHRPTSTHPPTHRLQAKGRKHSRPEEREGKRKEQLAVMGQPERLVVDFRL
ncbi:hypothetical protein INR49_025090 [Caranx melampygus]|nr:hypothetical protein INR49_025090 [Caranx melampygus]